MVLLCCCIYGTTSLISRQARLYKMPSLQFSADSSISIVLVTMSLFFYEHFWNGRPYTMEEARPVLLASAIMVVGTCCLNGATAYGKAGAVQALMQS